MGNKRFNILSHQQMQTMHKAVNKGLRMYADGECTRYEGLAYVLVQNPYVHTLRKLQWRVLATNTYNACVSMINDGNMRI